MPLRRHWMVLAAAVLSCYLVVLLSNAYRSQSQLRDAAEARLLAESHQTAVLMGDFLEDLRRFAADLTEIHEIETFLTNRALGMSMRYGLNANLAALEASFQAKLAQKRLLGAPVYARILYFDQDGTLLADTRPGAPLDPHLAAGAPSERLLIDEEHGRILASAPVMYRGNPSGKVVTLSRLDLLSRYLTSSAQELGFRQLLVTASGRPLNQPGKALPDASGLLSLTEIPPETLVSLDGLPALSDTVLSEAFDLALRVPVAQGVLSVVTLLPGSVLYGHITSRAFLYFASMVPVILVAVVLVIARMRRRARRLEADVIESNRNRAELQGRNDALTAEIARRKALETRLRESEERYRTYIEHAPEGVFVADSAGRLVDVNPSACDMVGYASAELLGMSVTDLAPPDARHEHLRTLEQVLDKGRYELEIDLRRKDGSQIVGSLRAITLPGQLVMGFCVDITERKRAEEQIHSLAYFDPLTGLPNRRLLLDRLSQLMAAGSRRQEYGALLMLDLDHFKDLNDTQGHDVGDRLLAEVARRLTARVRADDTVARIGGDEYVIVAGELGTVQAEAALQAEQIAEKIHRVLDRPYALVEGRSLHHSAASVGVALFCGQELSVDQILKQADVALYQAKNAGRNTVRFFNPDMQAAIEARATLEAALRCAIECDELQLYYQPQVDRYGRLVGAEALLRWLPPDGEPVSPVRFIPLAEETGLIIPIGYWVLEQACAQLRLWQEDPRMRGLTLSVNVSARQFHQPDLVSQVRETVAISGIDATRLKLELTESVVLDRVEQVIARMRNLKMLGLGFSLDDFGTGYSSLSYLKRLPLDQVKIDQAFVRDIVRDHNDAAIVRAVLAMSQSLGLNVVAEGVETVEQRDFLLQHGCELFQGYLFGKPVPIDALSLPQVPLTTDGGSWAIASCQ
nr:EAL domain-containing protein [Thiorhodococcus minor]